MTKFEEEFNYLIELSGKVLIGQVDAEAFEKNRVSFFEKYETDQQQALPVVPECVAELIKDAKENKKTIRWCLYGNCKELYPQAAEWIGAVDDIEFTDKTWKQQETFVRAWLDGYEVEKPQLFYIEFPKVSKRDSYPWVVEIEDGIIIDFTDKKSTALRLTEQEIKSIDERYWQFAVPVEDGE